MTNFRIVFENLDGVTSDEMGKVDSTNSVENEISDELAFNWWFKETLRHRDGIIPKVKAKYWRTSYNFGIRVTKTVK